MKLHHILTVAAIGAASITGPAAAQASGDDLPELTEAEKDAVRLIQNFNACQDSISAKNKAKDSQYRQAYNAVNEKITEQAAGIARDMIETYRSALGEAVQAQGVGENETRLMLRNLQTDATEEIARVLRSQAEYPPLPEFNQNPRETCLDRLGLEQQEIDERETELINKFGIWDYIEIINGAKL